MHSSNTNNNNNNNNNTVTVATTVPAFLTFFPRCHKTHANPSNQSLPPVYSASILSCHGAVKLYIWGGECVMVYCIQFCCVFLFVMYAAMSNPINLFWHVCQNDSIQGGHHCAYVTVNDFSFGRHKICMSFGSFCTKVRRTICTLTYSVQHELQCSGTLTVMLKLFFRKTFPWTHMCCIFFLYLTLLCMCRYSQEHRSFLCLQFMQVEVFDNFPCYHTSLARTHTCVFSVC